MNPDDSSLRTFFASRTVFIAGPTASGKSGFSARLSKRIGGELINADAFQLYRGLDVCTAKPTPEEQSASPHHLYSVLTSNENCDAQHYHDLAIPVIKGVLARGHWPIIVGGSGLYLKSLTHGLAPLPKADAQLRTQLAQMTPEERIAELLRLDPAAETNVPLQNDRYVTRALEICLLSGKPQSELRQSWQNDTPEFMGVLISRERDDLYQRINQRVHQMIQGGAIDEVRDLLASHCDQTAQTPSADSPQTVSTQLCPDHGLFKAIGVKQITSYLNGQRTLDETIADIQQATRRYAKRQATWFRREHGFQTVCLTPDSTTEFAVERILALFPRLQQPPT